LDPETDTPERLKKFKSRFVGADEHWHFLTSYLDTVRTFADEVGFKFWRLGKHVEHDFRILLLDSTGQRTAEMDWEHSDVQEFLVKLRRRDKKDN